MCKSVYKMFQNDCNCIIFFVIIYRIKERSPDDLEIIYEELVHIRALAHLSTTVKRELASIIAFESHPRADTVCKQFFQIGWSFKALRIL